MRVENGEPVFLNTGRRLESMRKGFVSRGCGSFPEVLPGSLPLAPLPMASLEAEASAAAWDIKKSL